MTIGWKLALGAILLALWTGTLWYVYHLGDEAGSAKVQTKWDTQVNLELKAANDEIAKYRAKEASDAEAAAAAAVSRQREQDAASAQARSLLADNDGLRNRYTALLASRRTPQDPASPSTGPSDEELGGLFAESRSLVVEGRQRLAECVAEVKERDLWVASVSK